MKVKVINDSMNCTRGGVFLPIGETVLDREDWDKFLAGATDDCVLLCLKTGSIRATPIESLPESLNEFTPNEIRGYLARTRDHGILKAWLWRAHESESFWRARALISQRLAELQLHPAWTPEETAELDRRAGWRYKDGYRHPSDIDRPDPKPNAATIERERLALEKAEKKRAAYLEYQEKLKQIGA